MHLHAHAYAHTQRDIFFFLTEKGFIPTPHPHTPAPLFDLILLPTYTSSSLAAIKPIVWIKDIITVLPSEIRGVEGIFF